MVNFSTLIKANGLDSDGSIILGKDSLNEDETLSVVPVVKLHSEKELEHTPILWQVRTNHTRIPTVGGSSIIPRVPEK